MALSRYCLDTSAYSWFMRGDAAAVDLVDSAEWVGMPSIVLGELHVGFRAGAHRRRNEEELERFLGHPVVEELPVDYHVADVYADIVRALREKGTPIPTNDVWVAATAAASGATLLAYDAHFAEVARVGLVLLAPSGS
ncbi:MAG: PIN domain-containing protein [Gaiellales bacterium]